MKIEVSKLKANPFRRISKYPFDKEKIKALKTSIKETSFWDNLLARANGGGYEIAYGHHRLKAIQSLGIKTVDLPVRKLDDATMLKIMANENLEDWKTSPAIVNETVLVAKEFLDAELAKCDHWNHLDKSIRVIFSSNSQFQECKQEGVGRTTILNFLGGNWKQWVIQEALSTLNDEDIDREAIEMMPSVEQGAHFKKAIKAHGISKQSQKGFAKAVIKSGVGKRGTKDIVAGLIARKHKKTALAKKELPMIDDFVVELTGNIAVLNRKLKRVVKAVDNIKNARVRDMFLHTADELYETLAKLPAY